MISRERIHAEIDRLDDESLAQLCPLIERFLASRTFPDGPGLMSKLKTVQIDAPEDFAGNLDLYVSGERRVEDHLH